jgi:hypothetical protein
MQDMYETDEKYMQNFDPEISTWKDSVLDGTYI